MAGTRCQTPHWLHSQSPKQPYVESRVGKTHNIPQGTCDFSRQTGYLRQLCPALSNCKTHGWTFQHIVSPNMCQPVPQHFSQIHAGQLHAVLEGRAGPAATDTSLPAIAAASGRFTTWSCCARCWGPDRLVGSDCGLVGSGCEHHGMYAASERHEVCVPDPP